MKVFNTWIEYIKKYKHIYVCKKDIKYFNKAIEKNNIFQKHNIVRQFTREYIPITREYIPMHMKSNFISFIIRKHKLKHHEISLYNH